MITIELTRPADGSLGFSLIQAEKGRTCALLVKCLTPDGAAKQDCRLRVGDRLLQVCNYAFIFSAMATRKTCDNLVNFCSIFSTDILFVDEDSRSHGLIGRCLMHFGAFHFQETPIIVTALQSS